MANEEATDRTPQQLLERVWQIATNADSVLLVTYDDEGLHARPMSARRLDGDDAVLRFLTDRKSHKVAGLREGHAAAMVYCRDQHDHVALHGRMGWNEDRDAIAALWTTTDQAWWNSPQDADLVQLVFTPGSAELWDKPNALIAAALVMTSTITGETLRLGDHARLDDL